MRAATTILAWTLAAGAALADTPSIPGPPTGTPPPGPSPSVWRATETGAYEHLASGLSCPQRLGTLGRRKVVVFDKYGLDVGCDYSDGVWAITFYLSRRTDADVASGMAEAKRELTTLGAARHPQLTSETRSKEGELDWSVALYSQDGGLHTGIWIADVSGWTLEYRATYPAADDARVHRRIVELGADVRAAAGPRLQTCAAAKTPERHGRLVKDKAQAGSSAMLSSLLGGVLQAAAAQNRPAQARPLTSCVENASEHAGFPMVFWRRIDAGGQDARSDAVTIATDGAPVTLDVSPSAAATLEALSAGGSTPSDEWTASYDRSGQVLVFGNFTGRPTLEAEAQLFAAMLKGKAKPIGGYSADGKNITVIAPSK